jgi:hypothetical protein
LSNSFIPFVGGRCGFEKLFKNVFIFLALILKRHFLL